MKTRLSLWANEIRNIRIENNNNLNMKHLNKIVFFNNIIFYIGYIFSFLNYNYIFPWVLMGLSISSHWTTISHHTCHGGYDDNKYNKFNYGRKNRRILDWMDYLLPEAWSIEHNIYHHYKLNEYSDPDNVQYNLRELREMKIPLIIKYIIILFFILTWRILYYSSNSYKYFKANQIHYIIKKEEYKQMTLLGIITNEWPIWINKIEYLCKVLLPIIIYRIIQFMPFYLIYKTSINNVILNYILAEIFCNIHTFIIIVPNHTGRDMYLYNTSVKAKSDEWLLRQTISSVNYNYGNDIIDYLHGWLNYQIEHHIFPNLSMLDYQLIQPEVKNICKKYNIPYVSENVFIRLYKTLKIMSGEESLINYEGSEIEKFVNEELSID